MASRKEKSTDSSRRSMSKNPPLNESYDYYSEPDNTEKWRKTKDEVEKQWKGLPSNKVLFQVGKSKKPTSKPRKKKQTNRNGLTNKQSKTERLMNEDYYEDYDETQEKPSSRTEMLRKVVPYLLQKYRPKRLHLYTNRKVDLDRSESQIGSSVEDALNTGRFAGDPRYVGPLTPKDVIGKISTIPRRPCHGPACHEHHKGLVRFYWRRVVFPRNRTRTRQRDLEENIEDEDYDEGDSRPPTRQKNRRRRRRNRNRGRNRSRGTQQEQSRDENNDYFDESNDEEEDQVNSRRNRNRNRTRGRGRNRQTNRNRQRVANRKQYNDYNDEHSQVYKDRNDYEEDK